MRWECWGLLRDPSMTTTAMSKHHLQLFPTSTQKPLNFFNNTEDPSHPKETQELQNHSSRHQNNNNNKKRHDDTAVIPLSYLIMQEQIHAAEMNRTDTTLEDKKHSDHDKTLSDKIRTVVPRHHHNLGRHH